MTPREEEQLTTDTGSEMGFGVQVILGFFLVFAFCSLAWLMVGNH
jgi:hypothetical protein